MLLSTTKKKPDVLAASKAELQTLVLAKKVALSASKSQQAYYFPPLIFNCTTLQILRSIYISLRIYWSLHRLNWTPVLDLALGTTENIKDNVVGLEKEPSLLPELPRVNSRREYYSLNTNIQFHLTDTPTLMSAAQRGMLYRVSQPSS